MKRADTFKFASEADLVAAFCTWVDQGNQNRNRGSDRRWTAYHETAGWDLILVNDATGTQVGIEAKLVLNAKVLAQALPGKWSEPRGPDFRAVLVPAIGLQHDLGALARHVGINIIMVSSSENWKGDIGHQFGPELPDEAAAYSMQDWHGWFPAERCVLPEYVPDVTGGKSAPVALTPWKIKAIKLVILLDRRGYVTRKDMQALKVSESRWTSAYDGFLNLDKAKGGYVRCGLTPDFKAQHPVNYAQIEADFDRWAKAHGLVVAPGAEAAA